MWAGPWVRTCRAMRGAPLSLGYRWVAAPGVLGVELALCLVDILVLARSRLAVQVASARSGLLLLGALQQTYCLGSARAEGHHGYHPGGLLLDEGRGGLPVQAAIEEAGEGQQPVGEPAEELVGVADRLG